ncbi:MAG: serine/threonine protein kinase, partial [Planctomycetes bacterium]|nr:serine/threonine protein kinase [Planctomycetota bacterium]
MSRESDLLFGLLALRMNFVSPEQFFGVAGPWIVGYPRSLPELLHERGFLRGTERKALESIVEAQMQVNGHEAIRLAGAGLDQEVRDRLLAMNPDADITALLRTTRPPASSPVVIATHPSGVRYKLGAEVGRGGLGRIVEAEDSALERTVAVKIVLEGLPARMSERFAREARLTARLEHPNIVPVYDFGALKGPDGVERVFMSMKKVRGRDLGQILVGLAKADAELVRVWSRTRLLMVFQSICLGVAYAHDRGVIHRDLKPANVMIGDYGETLIVDWGLARELGKREPAEDAGAPGAAAPSSRDNISHDDEIVGTPAFMAPEQAEGKKAGLDPRMDVYSLGAILYQILSLHPPFAGDTPQEIVNLVVSGHLVPPSVRAAVAPAAERGASAKVPPELDAICMKAMARLAADRYLSAMELH